MTKPIRPARSPEELEDIKRIKDLYAWVVLEDDGFEIIALARPENPDHSPTKLVGPDREQLVEAGWEALKVHRVEGRPVRLVRFALAEVLDERGSWPESRAIT